MVGEHLVERRAREARCAEAIVEPPDEAVDHHRCVTGRCARDRSAWSIDASQLAKSAAAPMTSAEPPKPHISAPATCWSRSASAPRPYTGYQGVRAMVMRIPSAV